MTSVISKHQNDRATYLDLDARSNALARGLESVGVQKGDRVAVMLGNSMEHATVRCATVSVVEMLMNPIGHICSIQAWSYLGR